MERKPTRYNEWMRGGYLAKELAAFDAAAAALLTKILRTVKRHGRTSRVEAERLNAVPVPAGNLVVDVKRQAGNTLFAEKIAVVLIASDGKNLRLISREGDIYDENDVYVESLRNIFEAVCGELQRRYDKRERKRQLKTIQK